MKETRIYGRNVEIRTENTKSFYDSRAKAMRNMANPYVSVLLGDQNPEYALMWDKFEKENILPRMEINRTCRVLDIGCGMGRWAEALIPISGYYCGTDVSTEMVKRAKERNRYPERRYDFLEYGFGEFCALPKESLPCRFNRLWICGVMMYINDETVINGMSRLLDKMDVRARAYLTETIAVKERLTLDGFYSEALKADYDVIYRTEGEYNQIYGSWLEAGFRVAEQGMLPHLNKEKEYSETERWYTILER